jgi:hypothetical protein
MPLSREGWGSIAENARLVQRADAVCPSNGERFRLRVSRLMVALAARWDARYHFTARRSRHRRTSARAPRWVTTRMTRPIASEIGMTQ